MTTTHPTDESHAFALDADDPLAQYRERFHIPHKDGKPVVYLTGNSLGCAAALASLELFDRNDVLGNIGRNAMILAEELTQLAEHPHVGEVRQKGIMVGIELVAEKSSLSPYPADRRTGHLVTLAARKRGTIIRPLGDVIVLMPAPGMPPELVRQLARTAIESIDEATQPL